jgi:hypothetical protein
MNHIVLEFFDCYAFITVSLSIGNRRVGRLLMNREAGPVVHSRLHLLLSEGARDDFAGNSQRQRKRSPHH